MNFKQIVILDKVTLLDDMVAELNKYSNNPVRVFDSDPKDSNEIVERLAGADCVLLSWRTPISKETIEKCSNLKFICLCATNSDCIDLEECSKRNIQILNVKDYGDEGVVEWIFFQLLNLVRGFGEYQWREEPSELSGKTVGIIGLGTIGKLIADVALGLNMEVIYFSRTRNEGYENKGVQFVDKKELLQKSDFITLQTPKNLKILNKEDFGLMKEKVLINNTLGRAFEEVDFIEWIKRPNNYAIMDAASDFKDKFKDLDRVIYSNFVSGLTREAAKRLSQKALDNVIKMKQSLN